MKKLWLFSWYESVKDNLIKYKCLSYNKDYLEKLEEKFKKRFKNIFKFSNNHINKFVLLLRKSVYPYECIDEWKKFDETDCLKENNFIGT